MNPTLSFKPDVRRYLSISQMENSIRAMHQVLGDVPDPDTAQRGADILAQVRLDLTLTYGTDAVDRFDAIIAEVDQTEQIMNDMSGQFGTFPMEDSSTHYEMIKMACLRESLDAMLFSWDASAHPMFVFDAEDQQEYDVCRHDVVEGYGEPLAKIVDEVWKHPNTPQCPTGYLVDLVQVIAEQRGVI